MKSLHPIHKAFEELYPDHKEQKQAMREWLVDAYGEEKIQKFDRIFEVLEEALTDIIKEELK